MDKFIYLWVFLGGGFGSMLRYFLDQQWNQLHHIPFGTLLSNVAASLILGVIAGYLSKEMISIQYAALIGVGFCGGFSTFSTFSKENSQFLIDGQYGYLAFYMILSIALSIGAFLGSYAIITKV